MEDGQLAIDVIPHGHSVELRLRGDLDLASVPTLRACLEQLDGQWRTVTLELSELEFLDSSGIALVVSTLRRFEPDYRTLVLRNPRPAVARVLMICGLDTLIPIESDQPAPGP